MSRLDSRWLLPLALLAGVVPIVWMAQCPGRTPLAALPLDDWDIPQLIAHLKEKGVELRVVPARQNGDLEPNCFLTTTDREWSHFNGLRKEPREIDTWRGTLYCERGVPHLTESELDRLWGDCYFTAGAFLFFGDRQLLERVRVALTPA